MTYGACVAYLVDVLHSRSSEILAANLLVFFFCRLGKKKIRIELTSSASVMRSVLVATTVAASLPMIDAYGTLVTYVLCAVLIWASFGYVFRSKGKKNEILIYRQWVVLYHQVW